MKLRLGNTELQFIKYAIAGGVAFALDFFLLWLTVEKFGLHYMSGTFIGYAAGILSSYLFSIYWVFDHRSYKVSVEFPVFALIAVIGICLTWVFMKVFTEQAGFHYLVSKILTTIIVTIWNFAAKKKLLFSKK